MELLKLYEELGEETINNLYYMSCLKASGIEDNKELLKLIPILRECYLKDENEVAIGLLSDMLVNIKDMVDLKNMSIRELLIKMYNNEE